MLLRGSCSLSKLQSRQNVKAHELEHATVHRHVEALQKEKQGLHKNLEETWMKMAQEERTKAS